MRWWWWGTLLSGTHRMLSVFLSLSCSLSSLSLAVLLSLILFLSIEWTHSVSVLRSFWSLPCWRQSKRLRCSLKQLDIQSSLENPESVIILAWVSWPPMDQPVQSGGWYLYWPKVKIKMPTKCHRGFPGGSDGKEPVCRLRRHKRCKFDPWIGKIPWRRAWQPTPVFLPGQSHGQRIVGGYSLWDHMTEATWHAHTHAHTKYIVISFFWYLKVLLVIEREVD